MPKFHRTLMKLIINCTDRQTWVSKPSLYLKFAGFPAEDK